MSCTRAKVMVSQEFLLCLVFKEVKAVCKLDSDLHEILTNLKRGEGTNRRRSHDHCDGQ